MRRFVQSLLLCLLVGTPDSLLSQLLPVGNEFQVAPATAGPQTRPKVAIADDGGFIIAWQQDTVDARRFAADGTPLDSGFQFPSSTTLGASGGFVSMAGDGSFIAVWNSFTLGLPGREVEARRFSSDGSALAPQFQVNSFTTGYQGSPKLATGPDGEFVITWTSDGSLGNDTDYASIQARPFDNMAVAQSDQFQVNVRAAWYQEFSAIDFQSTGDYILVWQETGGEFGDQSCHCVLGRRFDANGIPFGQVEFRMDRKFFSSVALHPRVAVANDDGFMTVWAASTLTGNDPDGGIYAVKYDASGVPADFEFQVNTVTTGRQRSPEIAATPDGGFLVVWSSASSEGTDSDGDSIQARRYDSDGRPFGPQVQINTVTAGNQRYPSVAVSAGGQAVVTWETDLGLPPFTNDDSVAQRFLLTSFVGNIVWSDRNRDGIQDPEEPGFPGVSVELFQDGNPVAISTTVTDASGFFNFSDLAAGQYQLRFIPPTPTTEISPQGQGLDASLNSDADPVTGFTASFALAAGEAISTLDAGMLETQLFVDGFETGNTGSWTLTTPP